ncbi:hypothetical protein MLP_09140 [Microlunatus phosphovorus NM-1]|uniref:Uncharacterized protein n=1 Tax=Microlunatus phosphovorus (strain ATCC 700054 / DSM 10555 / JCM 9379 / NBRC 101784 / NCIMB 13414 / VKM Ac-1990 / NM-1) TaxID=1032480 RepID=F5XMK5_MICPN|nr:hypothetical protein MLP_09140 [Microlunatus phosphovorus NM-1]
MPVAAVIFLATWAMGACYQGFVPALTVDQLGNSQRAGHRAGVRRLHGAERAGCAARREVQPSDGTTAGDEHLPGWHGQRRRGAGQRGSESVHRPV